MKGRTEACGGGKKMAAGDLKRKKRKRLGRFHVIRQEWDKGSKMNTQISGGASWGDWHQNRGIRAELVAL